jgi:DNA mismatch repair protein MutL
MAVRPSEAQELPGSERIPKRAFRFIGLLADRYVLMEEPGAGLVLLDHRAAQERLLFERLLRRMDSDQVESQRLLLPSVVELAPKDFQWIAAHAPLLASAGLLVEPFGTASVKVDGVPPVLAGLAVEDSRRLPLGREGRAHAGGRGSNRPVRCAGGEVSRGSCQ